MDIRCMVMTAKRGRGVKGIHYGSDNVGLRTE